MIATIIVAVIAVGALALASQTQLLKGAFKLIPFKKVKMLVGPCYTGGVSTVATRISSPVPSSVPSYVPTGYPSSYPSRVPSGISSGAPSYVASGSPSGYSSRTSSSGPSVATSRITSRIPSTVLLKIPVTYAPPCKLAKDLVPPLHTDPGEIVPRFPLAPKK